MKKGTVLIALIMTCLSVFAQSRFNGGEGGGYTSVLLENIVMSYHPNHKQDQFLRVYPNPAIDKVFLSVKSEIQYNNLNNDITGFLESFDSNLYRIHFHILY